MLIWICVAQIVAQLHWFISILTKKYTARSICLCMFVWICVAQIVAQLHWSFSSQYWLKSILRDHVVCVCYLNMCYVSWPRCIKVPIKRKSEKSNEIDFHQIWLELLGLTLDLSDFRLIITFMQRGHKETIWQKCQA